MENNDNLFNAAEMGENPATAFIVEGKHLHAVELSVANQKKDKSDPLVVLPLMREALKALIKFGSGKVEAHFLDVDWKSLEGSADEHEKIVHHVQEIYSHLHHRDRNELSTLIHHRKASR